MQHSSISEVHYAILHFLTPANDTNSQGHMAACF